MNQRSVLAGAALGVLLGAATAGADARVRGTVTDSTGQPIADAKVELSDPSTGRNYKAKTKKDGTYYQRGVLSSAYTLRVERDGYSPHIVEDVRVQEGVERTVDVTLRSLAERQAELRREQGVSEYGEGYDAFQKGDLETALAKAEAAIAAHPEDAKGYDMKAKALIGLKRYAEALPLLEKELGMPGAAPDVAEVLAAATYNAGVVASREERMDEAVAYWKKAQALGYTDPSLDNVLGRAYLARQEFAEAVRHLRAYLAAAPEAADAAEVRMLLDEIQKLEANK